MKNAYERYLEDRPGYLAAARRERSIAVWKLLSGLFARHSKRKPFHADAACRPCPSA